MEREIWKYKVSTEDYPVIEMPKGAKILTFMSQNNEPCIWCLVDPSEKTEIKKFRLAGTGHPIQESDEQLKYIGTCQLHSGALIFHLFEVIE